MNGLWDVAPCSLVEVNDGSEVLTASIIRAMIAVSTSETSANFYEITRRNIPDDSHLHTLRRENLKSHKPQLGLNNSIINVVTIRQSILCTLFIKQCAI
jgi:hypothetical protein